MAFDKIKKFMDNDFGEGNKVTPSSNNSDDYYEVSKDAFKDQNASSKMVLVEPRAYSESQQIADYLKARMSVVVNLKRVTPEQAKRIVDFLSGTLYAIGGELQKLGNGIFLCTPNNIMVEGKMSEETKETKNSKAKKEDNEEFDW